MLNPFAPNSRPGKLWIAETAPKHTPTACLLMFVMGETRIDKQLEQSLIDRQPFRFVAAD